LLPFLCPALIGGGPVFGFAVGDGLGEPEHFVQEGGGPFLKRRVARRAVSSKLSCTRETGRAAGIGNAPMPSVTRRSCAKQLIPPNPPAETVTIPMGLRWYSGNR
jgi:hypothetical protein